MENRWFHRAKLHIPAPGHSRRVGWLELFYDLIYVATLIQLGNCLSKDISVTGILTFLGLFAPLWVNWTQFTFFNNRFVIDDFTHRALVFVQMFAIGAMGVSVASVFKGDPTAFILSYCVVRAVIVALYIRAWKQVPSARGLAKWNAIGFGASGLLWLGSALLPWPYVYLAWLAAIVGDLMIPTTSHSRELETKFPVDILHMTERYGLLTIIVLGEGFVKVLDAVSKQWGQEHGGGILGMGALGLVITCSLWWIYFDDVAGSRIKRKALAPYVWIYAHLPMTAAMTAVGVALKKAVLFEPYEVAYPTYRIAVCATLGVVLLSVGFIDAVTERRQAELSDRVRVNVRVGAGLFMFLLVPVGAGVPAWVFLALVAAVMVSQVLFDMISAPLADAEAAHHESPVLFEPVPDEDDEDDDQQALTVPRRTPDVRDAIRVGTPNEFRRDLYFHLMDGSWLRLFGITVVAYALVNVAFAALFLLEPGSVSGVAANDFLAALSFSVQTFTTIGYGSMVPTTDYAHVLMIIEAFVGLLSAALVTGVIFAKASRPVSSVMWSNTIVVNLRDGVPTVEFRLGNARGNEVVEAALSVSLLRTEVTPEGHRMRKLHDIELVRSRTPVFTLSWTVMHRVDENSPMFGITKDEAEGDMRAVIVTMTGHDATYAQTVHARHIYGSGDFRYAERFVDVISTTDDGLLRVDYGKFHDTVPDEGLLARDAALEAAAALDASEEAAS